MVCILCFISVSAISSAIFVAFAKMFLHAIGILQFAYVALNGVDLFANNLDYLNSF